MKDGTRKGGREGDDRMEGLDVKVVVGVGGGGGSESKWLFSNTDNQAN